MQKGYIGKILGYSILAQIIAYIIIGISSIIESLIGWWCYYQIATELGWRTVSWVCVFCIVIVFRIIINIIKPIVTSNV